MPDLDALLGAANKSNAGSGSTIKICFAGNYPDVYTEEEYLRETKNVKEVIRAAISSQGEHEVLNSRNCSKGESPEDMRIQISKPEGSVEFITSVYPMIPEWDDIVTLSEASYEDLMNSEYANDVISGRDLALTAELIRMNGFGASASKDLL